MNATSYKYNNIDLSNIFQSRTSGINIDTHYKLNGVDLSNIYQGLGLNTPLNYKVGYSVNGVDFNQIFAPKNIVYPFVISNYDGSSPDPSYQILNNVGSFRFQIKFYNKAKITFNQDVSAYYFLVGSGGWGSYNSYDNLYLGGGGGGGGGINCDVSNFLNSLNYYIYIDNNSSGPVSISENSTMFNPYALGGETSFPAAMYAPGGNSGSGGQGGYDINNRNGIDGGGGLGSSSTIGNSYNAGNGGTTSFILPSILQTIIDINLYGAGGGGGGGFNASFGIGGSSKAGNGGNVNSDGGDAIDYFGGGGGGAGGNYFGVYGSASSGGKGGSGIVMLFVI